VIFVALVVCMLQVVSAHTHTLMLERQHLQHLCTCVCVCVHTHSPSLSNIHVYVCICAYIYIYICIYIFIHTYVSDSFTIQPSLSMGRRLHGRNVTSTRQSLVVDFEHHGVFEFGCSLQACNVLR